MSGFAINRWIVRRQRKILLYSVVCFVLLVTYITMFQDDIQIRESHYTPLSEQCLSDAAQNLVQSICHNFTSGLAYGSFCEHMCAHGSSVRVDKCFRHGRTTVLLGENKGKQIVMKMKKKRHLKHAVKTIQDAVAKASWSVAFPQTFWNALQIDMEENLGSDRGHLFQQKVASISQLLFGKPPSDVTFNEMKSSLDILGQDELVLTLMHDNINSFPRILGVCGPIYFLDRIRPYSEYFPEIIPFFSWSDRVRIARSFLTMVEGLEKTSLGPLFHCDVKEGNFGLGTGNHVLAIDGDLIYSRDKLTSVLKGRSCDNDEQCRLHDCQTQCHTTTNTCTNVTLVNNFQLVCRDVFLPGWPRTGLLTYFQPSHISAQLTELLNTCRSQQFGVYSMQHQKVTTLMRKLHFLLGVSLQNMPVVL